MSLSRDEVHIWRVPIARTASAHVWAMLSEDDKRRARQFQSPLYQSRWLWAHAALRDILGKYLDDGQPLRSWTSPLGKPRLCGVDMLNFNLSHSGKWALIVVAREVDVGIDVERIREDVELEVIARRTFSAAETASLCKLNGQDYIEGFYCCWTRKEAFVKALGLGLSADLSAFDVSVEPGHAQLLAVRPPLPCSPPWTLADVVVDENHKAAVAVQGEKGVSYRLLDWHRDVGS